MPQGREALLALREDGAEVKYYELVRDPDGNLVDVVSLPADTIREASGGRNAQYNEDYTHFQVVNGRIEAAFRKGDILVEDE